MDEDQSDLGDQPPSSVELLAAPAGGHLPTVVVDKSIAAAPEQSYEDQQHCGGSPHRSETSTDAPSGAHRDPPVASVSPAQAPSVRAGTQSLKRSRCDGTAVSKTFAAESAGAATDLGTETETEGDAGNGASPPDLPDLGFMPGEVKEDTAGGAKEEPVVEPSEPGAPSAVGDDGADAADAADAGGADSDGKESNDSVCNECGGGGEVVCCDGCVKSYHADCLPVAARPRLRANADDWFCPDCSAASAAAPSSVAITSSGAPKASQGVSDPRHLKQGAAAAPASPIYPVPAPAASWTALPSSYVPTRRRKAKATEDYETRINVGPNHQVPHLPDFFLARGDSDALSNIAEQSLTDGAQSQALGPLLVYSPYLMERSKQQCLTEAASKSCITSQKDLADFLIKCSKRWKVRPGWQPFSPEFAYKLLHRANYDPERALRMMDDSAFCFQSICDPPLRKYENKWKRRDKRGTFPSSPYPPPVVVRGHLQERQKQLRLGR